jgi:hypothetical protein
MGFMILRIDSGYFHRQYRVTALCRGDGVFSVRGGTEVCALLTSVSCSTEFRYFIRAGELL